MTAYAGSDGAKGALMLFPTCDTDAFTVSFAMSVHLAVV